MHIFLNCLAASAGGGLTYVRNVIPHLAACPDIQATVAVSPQVREQCGSPPSVSLVTVETAPGAGWRFLAEQFTVPGLIRKHGADVLISTGNFALRRSPVPQILLAGNSLYTSGDFSRDLLVRRECGMWLGTRVRGLLARRSVQWADWTVTPSQSFRQEIRNWSGNTVAIPHGFDPNQFFGNKTPLPAHLLEKLAREAHEFRILFVSHYNYYRNFETLFRALPRIVKNLPGRKVRLFLTCTLFPNRNPGAYRTEYASKLIHQLGISDHVVQLGTIPYQRLHHVYRSSDAYVTPAYAETFAHPLVEAMASGLPIVASDIPVHREVCTDAALYFPRFSEDGLAQRTVQIAQNSELAGHLAQHGRRRSMSFSWAKHVAEIVRLASTLLAPGRDLRPAA
jgi:glycosyltransferase involved in cell wall biosynthesis